jgi:hypothetical protein
LTGFMKSPAKPQPDIKAKQGLDKDALSLTASTKQVENVMLDANGIQRAGDVSGHGGSMSAQHGSVSPIALHDKHLADRQSAADVIRNGSSLSLQHSVEANGNNSNASLQVDASKLDENLGVGPISPTTQALQEYQDNVLKDIQERKDAAEERRRSRRKEKLPSPSSSDVEGQRVLTEAFCINRLDIIRQMVGSAKLGVFADGKDNSARAEQIAQFFEEFRRQNAEDDSPYFCVSAPILGRLMHTFKDNYISRSQATEVDFDLTQHVDEIVEKAKGSMLEDALTIRVYTKTLIDKQQTLLSGAHARLEKDLAAQHAHLAAQLARISDVAGEYSVAHEEALPG